MALSLLVLLSPNLRACGQTWISLMANRDILRVRGQWWEPTVTSKTWLWPGWQITSLQIGQWVSSSFSLQKILRITLESTEALMLQCLRPVPVRGGLTSTSLPSYLPAGDRTRFTCKFSIAILTHRRNAPIGTEEEAAAPSTEETPPVTVGRDITIYPRNHTSNWRNIIHWDWGNDYEFFSSVCTYIFIFIITKITN